jgi:hypothetical protein
LVDRDGSPQGLSLDLFPTELVGLKTAEPVAKSTFDSTRPACPIHRYVSLVTLKKASSIVEDPYYHSILNMPLGILEPTHTEHAPGTVDVYAEALRGTELLASHPELKKSKDRTKILIPQPSDDPNDPLVSHSLLFACRNLSDKSRTGHYGSAISFWASSASSRSTQRSPRPYSPQTQLQSRSSSEEHSKRRRSSQRTIWLA